MDSNNVFVQGFENINFDPFEDSLINNTNIFQETQRKLMKTPYFNPYEFKGKKEINSFSILHVNIRSIHQNFDKFKEFLNIINYTFDVISLTETWHENTLDSNSNYKLPNYNLISQARGSNKYGGGVGVYVIDKYSYKIKNKLCSSNLNYESLFLK